LPPGQIQIDLGLFSLGFGLGEFKPDLGHNLWVEFLQFCCELSGDTAVKQNGNQDIDGFSSKKLWLNSSIKP